jgi:cytochrome b subunit of formate dehydrogenase
MGGEMMRTANRLMLLMIVALSLSTVAGAASTLAVDPMQCLECHADSIDSDAFARSVHSPNACTSCHVEITDLGKHLAGEIEIKPVRCARCHKDESAAHYASVHMLSDIGCSACHADIHEMRPWDGAKGRVVEVCGGCHDAERYEASVHGKAVREGNPDSAACHDCHNLHEIKPLEAPDTEQFRLFHTRVCLDCHGDGEMMERNGVFPMAVDTYFESYHGKSYRLGSGRQVAGCVDCHSAHNILPEDDPDSSINPDNLVETCRQCHSEVTTRFTEFYVHGDHSDRRNYPVLFWTFVLMTALVVAVFAVFWFHTLFWMFRGFVENRHRAVELAEGKIKPLPDGHKAYRRFRKRHIVLHLIVIVSFLGLSLTGLPLKFSEHSWARAMMSFYGGVQNAGLLHRACAVLTFYYFFVALAMSFQFLFIRRDIPGNWLQRLFGPDSLMPNTKDLRDVRGMIRWFLFRGPKPQFERWTYWEKFDFFAVFWGMFAIGGSGLLLWFPEFFCRFLPGWLLNVATIIHSDEALLATGFIFTVHFFNTHGRPEKFPMDFVIFNGEISKEELILERGEQWRRYEELGVTENFRVRKSSGILYDFILKGFGFLALFTGLLLAFLIFSAFIWG